MRIGMNSIAKLAAAVLLAACGSEGKISPDAGTVDGDTDTDTETETDTETGDSEVGFDFEDIHLDDWGDCESNDWVFEPPVSQAFSFEDNGWTAVELHGYLRKLAPYVYLDVQTWTEGDAAYPLDQDIDLSAEVANIFECESCVLFFEACNNPNPGEQECTRVYWAEQGTLRITARGTALGESLIGSLTDVVFHESQINYEDGTVTPVEDGEEICVHLYEFDEELVEYSER
ncbi:MAG: hypothetical protein R6V85_03170 [Polyangia bacterium]